MQKPTDLELEQALTEAERMRVAGEDPHHLAKAALYLSGRVQALERVLQAADLYMHFGQPEKEHASLLHAIEAAKREELKATQNSEETFGADPE